MKKRLVSLSIVLATTAFAAPMSRVIGVRDSHTLIVDTKGVVSTVAMKNVTIGADEEEAAAEYLRRVVANAWVLVDNGDVYRSPDALFVNGDMNRHPWRSMKYLGQVDLGPRAKNQPATNSVKAPSMPPPLKNPAPKPRKVTQARRGKGA